jgi:preprotein translocase subunit SecD
MRIQLSTRTWITGLIGALAILAVLPSLTPDLPAWWADKVPVLHLGLDLKGGMEVLLGVDTQGAVDGALATLAGNLKVAMKDERIRYEQVEASGGAVTADLILPKGKEELVSLVNRQFPGVTVADEGETRLRLSYPEREAARIKENAVVQSLETIRNRVDQFGVTEPTIVRQGAERILVQLPGIDDPNRAIALIKRTAVLKFMILDAAGTPDSPGAGNILMYGPEVDPQTGRSTRVPYVLRNRVLLRGDTISDARVKYDSQNAAPYVSLSFNSMGSKIFEQVTADHVNERLAIVLDEEVKSAPVIRERIAGGQAQISGSFTAQEASDLAIVLRAGSLPAPVKVLQKWTVSPTLGADSIRKGLTSMATGFTLIVSFMVVYYGVSGFFAIVALLLNIILIPACLSLFGSTLTMPGMAGIVLTLGMAVDANVLIYERIREELRGGKTIRGAVDAGFSRAFLTIFDSHMTSFITALVLFQFGTGSIKGFAVTMVIGIVASLFTAVFVTRTIFEWYLRVRPVNKLSV